MAKRNASTIVFPIKDDENEQPIPTAWRCVFCEIVKAFIREDYRLSVGIPGVAPTSAKTAKQIKEYIDDYGEKLVELPEKAWASSVCLWMGKKSWDVLVDLWTKREGRSDLVLRASVTDTKSGFVVTVDLVYVP